MIKSLLLYRTETKKAFYRKTWGKDIMADTENNTGQNNETLPSETEPRVLGAEEEIKIQTPAAETAGEKPHLKRASIKHLQEELDKLRIENADLKDQLLRKFAEFDNFRKRTERDFISLCLHANETLLIQLLPILDDMERALRQPASIPLERDNESFRQGIELIYSKLFKTLQDNGLKPMETDGKEFDPHLHDALMQIEKPEIPSHHIIETYEKGYYYNDKVIRHAKVSVSK